VEALEDRCLLSSGALDPTFGSGGIVTTALTKESDYAHGVLVQSNGDLIAYGTADTGSNKFSLSPPASFGLVRYTPNGSLDTTFGHRGIVITSQVGNTAITANDFALPFEGVSQAALQADGKIVAVGNNLYVVRYNANGSIDTTFGSQGLVVVPSGFSTGSLLIQPSNGDILVGGSYNSQFALLRYTPRGALDPTFGSGGEVVTSSAAGIVVALALENGDIVAGGGQSLVRYTLSGNLDTTFGAGGIVTIPMGFPSLVVQPNGEIVAVGTTPAPTGYMGGSIDYIHNEWELARYNVNGSLDTTFGSGGTVTTSIGGSDRAYGSAMQSNGQIVVIGYTEATNDFELGVYNADGSVDTSFGSSGFVTQASATPSNNSGDAWTGGGVAIQPDGKIVAATFANVGNSSMAAFMLARYGASAAQIGSFTASPNPVTAGSSVTLTASNITLADPTSTITQVAFYYIDSSGNQVTLGTVTVSSGGAWTLTSSTGFGLTTGTYTLYAQAEDSDGILGDPLALTLTVQ
jgi:uncharacterized delta-60 repeat protein